MFDIYRTHFPGANGPAKSNRWVKSIKKRSHFLLERISINGTNHQITRNNTQLLEI